MSNILISGGSGMIGSRLSEMLLLAGHSVGILTRYRANKAGKIRKFVWDIENQEIDKEAIPWADHVIHLAGESVGQRWTKRKKSEILDSRIASTNLITNEFRKGTKVQSFISASAIGYYGDDTGSDILTESSMKGSGFLADVVEQWEEAVDGAEAYVDKVVKVRIGIVLSKKGGALSKMALPIKWGVGSALGNGQQWMSWVHLDDLCRMFLYVIENPVSHVVNGVSPNPITNKEFTKLVAKKLNRPLFLPRTPEIALKILFGEMAVLALGSNKVMPAAFNKEGFTFEYRTLPDALDSLL
jgi:uncharacterized protein (TIGR01777 family)